MPETIVIVGRGASIHTAGYRYYAGVMLTLGEESLTLSLLPPFNTLCPPIDLPFDAIRVKETDWGFWYGPYSIRLPGLDDVDIILRREAIQWIRENTDRPPFGLGA